MKLKTCMTLVALASMAAGASAANVTPWGALGPVPSVAFVAYTTTGPIDDVYTFNLSATSDVDAYAEEFEARSASMPGATFTLFSGTFGDPGATQVGSPFAFSNASTETVYSALTSGTYFFEVMGATAFAGSAYDFEAFANASSPPLNVPEPASAALVLAGIGLVAFMSRRRRQQ